MAHNIHINKLNEASFYSARELPWHGLGTVTKEAVTSEEAIKLAHLDYNVEKSELNYNWNDNGHIVHDLKIDRFVTIRKDTGQYLGGIVSKDYQIIQNVEAFNFMDSLIQDQKLVFETAGALGVGETVFITCKLPGEIIIGKDNIDKYLLLTMSHDGKSSIQVMFTPVRVVCNNTLSMALGSSKNKISIRHSANYKSKLQEAKRVLVKSEEAFSTYKDKFEILNSIKLKDTDITTIIKSLFLDDKEKEELQNGKLLYNVVSTRKKNIMNDVWRSYNQGVGQEDIKGTAWGFVNGVTNYFQNVKEYKNSEQQFGKVFDNNPIVTNAFNYFLGQKV